MKNAQANPITELHTIIAFNAVKHLKALTLPERETQDVSKREIDQQKFKIRLTRNDHQRQSANLLIEKMYAWRGYSTVTNFDRAPNKITLSVFNEEQVIGTLTLGFDSPAGLQVDAMYPHEINAARDAGRSVCEITQLAVDENVRSKKVLASIFHMAYIYAHQIYKCSDTLIEVNPRHVLFYEKMLGFKHFGQQKICPRVNAPAVLLKVETSYVETQIAKFGGKMETAAKEKSLYPYFFSKMDEIGITNRLRPTPTDTLAS